MRHAGFLVHSPGSWHAGKGCGRHLLLRPANGYEDQAMPFSWAGWQTGDSEPANPAPSDSRPRLSWLVAMVLPLVCAVWASTTPALGAAHRSVRFPASARRLAKAQVRMVHGYPQLFINGRMTPPLMVFPISNTIRIRQMAQAASEIRLAAAAGIHIIQCAVGGKLPARGSRVTYYRQMDRIFSFALKNDPRAYLLPTLWCGVQGFRRTHPADLVTYIDRGGKVSHHMASVASRSWYAAVKQALIGLIRHIKASRFAGRVIGFHLGHGNTSEWFTPDFWDRPGFDYSLANRQGFIRWLKRHYHTSAALRAAWHNPRITFDAVMVPPPLPGDPASFYTRSQQNYVDYLNYQSDITARRIEQLAAVVKRHTDRRSLVVTYYGYAFSCPAPDSSSRALGRLLRCPNIDAIASPVSYSDRQPGGAPNFMGAVDSATLHGKLWMLEDDTLTFVSTKPGGGPGGDGFCKTLGATVAVHRRNFGQMMIHRLGTWWLDLFSRGWLNNPGIWKNIGQLRAAYVQEPPSGQFRPQVAVVFDERSASYAVAGHSWRRLYADLLCNPTPFFHCGVSVGWYLLSDIGRLPSSVRTIIFLNAWRVNAATRRLIRRRLQLNGRTLVWVYGGGFINRQGSLDLTSASRLVGMRLMLSCGDLTGSDIIEPNALHLPPERVPGLNAPNSACSWLHFASDVDTPYFVVSPHRGILPLAHYRHGGLAMAVRRLAHYQSIFIGDPRPTAAFWRALFPHLGVHVYLNTHDAFQTDGRLMMISSDGVAGPRVLRLPRRGSIYDMLNGHKLAANVRRYRFSLRRYQTLLWRVVPTRQPLGSRLSGPRK